MPLSAGWDRSQGQSACRAIYRRPELRTNPANYWLALADLGRLLLLFFACDANPAVLLLFKNFDVGVAGLQEEFAMFFHAEAYWPVLTFRNR